MNRSTRPKTNRPTFALLREKRELRVRNPENGARFTISLRDWQAMLWAVRVLPSRSGGSAATPMPLPTASSPPADRGLAGGTADGMKGRGSHAFLPPLRTNRCCF